MGTTHCVHSHDTTAHPTDCVYYDDIGHNDDSERDDKACPGTLFSMKFLRESP